MSDSSPYRRYVVVEVRTVKWCGAGPAWHDRCATAEEGFRSLEARIAGEYLDTGMRPQIALVDCRERRVLGSSLPDLFAAQVVDWASRYAVVEPGADIAMSVAPSGQEPPGPAGESAEEDEEDAEEAKHQELIDTVVGSFLAGAVHVESLEELQERLEEEGDFYGHEAHCAVSRDALASWLAQVLEEGEHRELLGLSEEEVPGTEELLRLLTDHGLASLLEDADLSAAFAPSTITDSAGRAIVLVSSVRGYSFSGIEVEWYGAYAAWPDFLESIRGQWFSSAEEIEALSREDKLALIEGVMDG